MYRWCVLPFGLSTAPRAYTKLTRVMLKHRRKQGIRCSNYIDDFVFAAATREEALQLRDQLLRDMVRYGWFVSFSKSLLGPGQLAACIGFEFIITPRLVIRVPDRKVNKVLSHVSRVLHLHAAGRRVEGYSIARIAGHLQAMRFAMPPVSLFTRAMYAWLGRLPFDEATGPANFLVRRPLTTTLTLELQFWQAELAAWNGSVLQQAPYTRVLYTDASGQR